MHIKTIMSLVHFGYKGREKKDGNIKLKYNIYFKTATLTKLILLRRIYAH